MPPSLEVTEKGKFVRKTVTGAGELTQFATIASDGQVLFWDLRKAAESMEERDKKEEGKKTKEGCAHWTHPNPQTRTPSLTQTLIQTRNPKPELEPEPCSDWHAEPCSPPRTPLRTPSALARRPLLTPPASPAQTRALPARRPPPPLALALSPARSLTDRRPAAPPCPTCGRWGPTAKMPISFDGGELGCSFGLMDVPDDFEAPCRLFCVTEE